MNQQELKNVLEKHCKWLTGEDGKERANLTGANLTGADLTGADLTEIRADFMMRLALVPVEAVGLLKALWDGKVEGSAYQGECACFVGTIANIRKCDYRALGALKPEADSPTEKWFMGISRGQSPESNPVARITVGWIEEFLKERAVAVPTGQIVWSDEPAESGERDGMSEGSIKVKVGGVMAALHRAGFQHRDSTHYNKVYWTIDRILRGQSCDTLETPWSFRRLEAARIHELHKESGWGVSFQNGFEAGVIWREDRFK